METQRLYFREISVDDTQNIVRWRSDPSVYKYFLNPHEITAEEHKDWFENRYLNDNNRTDYIAILKDLNLEIGVFGLIYIPQNNQIEINYLIDEIYRGKGLAFEAVSYLMNFAKEKYGVKTVIAEIHKENTVSQKLAKRLGLSKSRIDGEFIIFEKKL